MSVLYFFKIFRTVQICLVLRMVWMIRIFLFFQMFLIFRCRFGIVGFIVFFCICSEVSDIFELFLCIFALWGAGTLPNPDPSLSFGEHNPSSYTNFTTLV